MKKTNKKTSSKKNKSAKHEWLKAFLIALIVIILLRIFAFQFYVMPDSKMEATLFTGDYVIINKLAYGARLTLPFINDSGNTKFKYLRFPGYSNISRNALVLFNYPFESGVPVNEKTTNLIRCVAIPCDTLNIVDKKVFVNGTCVDLQNNNKYRYRIFAKKELAKKFFQNYLIDEGGGIDSSMVYDFFITKETAEQISKDSAIKNINLIKLTKNAESMLFFPQSENYNWNLDYFGPIIVPAKDSTVDINYKNIQIYKKIIETYENNKLEIKTQNIFINGIESNKYTFKMNYYFMLDDNRDNGKDSRYWGFVPENHIIGKASFVLFSIGNKNSEKSFHWNRIFKML